MALNRAAKRARRNKRADLADLYGERKGRGCAPPNK
jgi:hypothetical protein